jgi:copper chaperone CopZ
LIKTAGATLLLSCQEPVNQKELMKKEISIDGMSCMHCHKTVTKKLNSLDGVDSTEVNLDAKNAVVESGQNIDDATLKAAITDAGFTVTGIKAL